MRIFACPTDRTTFAIASALVFTLGACASNAEDIAADGGSDARVAASDAGESVQDATIADAGDAAVIDEPWSPVSFGITGKRRGSGNDVAIVYGGYTATDADAQAWVAELQRVSLGALGVGHLYAVRGPKDADYASREIGNSTLATTLATLEPAAKSIIIVAHSSGGFVADELFTFASPAVLAKIAYFNLDGGSWSLTSALVSKMKNVTVCNAHDPVAGNSENTSSDQSLHAKLAGSHLFTVDATGSGCNVGAGWCLHDTLIIDHPHDPATYDLALDYTDFTGGRHVVTSYIDQAVSDAGL